MTIPTYFVIEGGKLNNSQRIGVTVVVMLSILVSVDDIRPVHAFTFCAESRDAAGVYTLIKVAQGLKLGARITWSALTKPTVLGAMYFSFCTGFKAGTEIGNYVDGKATLSFLN